MSSTFWSVARISGGSDGRPNRANTCRRMSVRSLILAPFRLTDGTIGQSRASLSSPHCPIKAPLQLIVPFAKLLRIPAENPHPSPARPEDDEQQDDDASLPKDRV